MNLYLSNEKNIKTISEFSGLDYDEIESLVGRFTKHSTRAGNLRGEFIFDEITGEMYIRHHFTKKILWSLK